MTVTLFESVPELAKRKLHSSDHPEVLVNCKLLCPEHTKKINLFPFQGAQSKHPGTGFLLKKKTTWECADASDHVLASQLPLLLLMCYTCSVQSFYTSLEGHSSSCTSSFVPLIT